MEVAHERGAEGRVIASFIGVFREHTIEGGSEAKRRLGKWGGGGTATGNRGESRAQPPFYDLKCWVIHDVKGDLLSQEQSDSC